MPELGEVAHAVSLLRRYLLQNVIKVVEADVDELLFVKPLTNTIFKSTLEGSTITDVRRNGKYFWFEVNGTQTVLLHFGMTGWIHVKDTYTHFIAMENAGDKKQKELMKTMAKKPTGPVIEERPSENWPPKFVKFKFLLDNGREIVFTDPRRLGRCRLFDVPASEVGTLDPIKKLGRDYTLNPLDFDEFHEVSKKRRVPVKAYLLDQAVFSGVGNWMGDEILYQARIHPEQYTNTLNKEQVQSLYKSVLDVCDIALRTEGNTAAFPENWLMLHRWGKRRKNDPQITPWGHEYEFVTVGGRTSCYVPEVQVLPGGNEPVKKANSKTALKKQTTKTKSGSGRKRLKKEVKEESEEEFPEAGASESDENFEGESEVSEVSDGDKPEVLPKKKRR